MGAAFDYAQQVATDDVRDALTWLVGAGYVIDEERGGSQESFGNVRLALSKAGTSVTVSRDRGQWFVAVRPPWAAAPIPMHVLETARDGVPPSESVEFLPVQPPHDASWTRVLPSLLAWSASPDTRVAIEAADRAWRDFMRDRLAPPPQD